MFISSTLVREIAFLDGDISQFVPACVVRELKRDKMKTKLRKIYKGICLVLCANLFLPLQMVLLCNLMQDLLVMRWRVLIH